MQSSEFFEKFSSLEERKPSTANKSVTQLVFKSELQFHAKKEPQKDPQNSRKKFWQLFDKLVNFY